MKKLISILSLGVLIATTSCGGNNKSAENDNESSNTASETSTNQPSLVADPSISSQNYSQYVDFSGPAALKVDGHMLEINVPVKIKTAANQINDNDNTELIVLDGSGAVVATFHQFGRDSSFEEALFSGDTSYSDDLTFIMSADDETEANEIAKKAKSYKINMALKAKPENKYADWSPVGKYEFEDAGGTQFTLIVKKGGSAELINHNFDGNSEYTPSKGSWSKNSELGYVEMDFFGGPFVLIGEHMAITSPVLTPDYLYYDRDAYNEDDACLEVKKVE